MHGSPWRLLDAGGALVLERRLTPVLGIAPGQSFHLGEGDDEQAAGSRTARRPHAQGFTDITAHRRIRVDRVGEGTPPRNQIHRRGRHAPAVA